MESLRAECQGNRNVAGAVTTVFEIVKKGPDELIQIALLSLDTSTIFFEICSAFAWAVTPRILPFSYGWRVFSSHFFFHCDVMG